MPAASVDGMSKVVDFKGRVLASAATGESMVANAEIDLSALRSARRKPGMPNYLVRQRLELFADSYAKRTVYPANSIDPGTVPERSHFIAMQRATIDKLIDDDLI